MFYWTVYPLLAGTLGVLMMNFIMREERLVNLPSLNFIMRLGFVYETKPDSKWVLRLAHFLIGIFFAYVYFGLFQTVLPDRNPGPVLIILIFGVAGCVHGVLSMMFLVISTKEENPIRPEKGFEPSEMVSFIFAYAGYGATIGCFIGFANQVA